MNKITPMFLQYCKEKKIFPESLIHNEQWANSVDYLILKIRDWYNEGGKENYLKFLEKEYNIIIEEGITNQPCRGCGEASAALSPFEDLKNEFRTKKQR